MSIHRSRLSRYASTAASPTTTCGLVAATITGFLPVAEVEAGSWLTIRNLIAGSSATNNLQLTLSNGVESMTVNFFVSSTVNPIGWKRQAGASAGDGYLLHPSPRAYGDGVATVESKTGGFASEVYFGGSKSKKGNSNQFNAWNSAPDETAYILLSKYVVPGLGTPEAWIEVSLDLDAGSLVIHDWYMGAEGEAVYAGQQGAPVPGPAGLLALACGAAGLRRARQRA